MSFISQIFISSPDVVIGKGQQRLPAFQKNQIVQAEVVKVISPRQAQLNILGKMVWAETHAALKEGETVRLKADTSNQQQVFKLMKPGENPAWQVDHHRLQSLGRPGPYVDFENISSIFAHLKETLSSKDFALFEQFSQLLKDISLKSDTPDIQLIRNLIKRSGLTWEFNLASSLDPARFPPKEEKASPVVPDLKALALKLMDLLPDAESEAGRIIRNFTGHLEQLQLLNHLAHEESGKYLLYLPVLLDQRLKFGQMLVDFGSGKNSQKETKDRLIKVSLILGMSDMGDVLADFSVFKKLISGYFGVGDTDVCEFIKQNIPELENKLGSHGFEIQHIDCRLIDPDRLANISFIENMTDLSEGSFHLVI